MPERSETPGFSLGRGVRRTVGETHDPGELGKGTRIVVGWVGGGVGTVRRCVVGAGVVGVGGSSVLTSY